jgi:hypothetical protein
LWETFGKRQKGDKEIGEKREVKERERERKENRGQGQIIFKMSLTGKGCA